MKGRSGRRSDLVSFGSDGVVSPVLIPRALVRNRYWGVSWEEIQPIPFSFNIQQFDTSYIRQNRIEMQLNKRQIRIWWSSEGVEAMDTNEVG